MKSIENPSSFLFRPDQPVPAPVPKKKNGVKSFLSIFKAEADNLDSETEGKPSEMSEAELGQQMDRIHELGQGLIKRQTIDQIQEYKSAVKQLVQLYLDRGIQAAELVSSRSVLNQKKYTIIRVIDEKLERLVTGILQSQGAQLDMLSKLEEIQGLLVDLFH